MAKVAVLGGGGFIGCNLVKYLVDKGHTVRAVDLEFRVEREKMWGKAQERMTLDLRDPMGAILAIEGCEWVFHLASDMGGVGYFTSHDYYPYINNMQMDMNVLQACEKSITFKRLFYSSSACVYPIHIQQTEGQAPQLREDMIYPANSDLSYGWEKLMMLRLCERAPFDARVGIFHTIFGDYQELQGERMKAPTALATKAITSLKTGKFEIWGNGKQLRSFCYIADALEKIYSIMTMPYEGPVNVGSDIAVTVDQCAQWCCEIVGAHPEFTHNVAKPSGVISRNCDNTKFERLYQYKNQYDTKQGFEKLIHFIQDENSNR